MADQRRMVLHRLAEQLLNSNKHINLHLFISRNFLSFTIFLYFAVTPCLPLSFFLFSFSPSSSLILSVLSPYSQLLIFFLSFSLTANLSSSLVFFPSLTFLYSVLPSFFSFSFLTVFHHSLLPSPSLQRQHNCWLYESVCETPKKHTPFSALCISAST